jgi:hypothetical protein
MIQAEKRHEKKKDEPFYSDILKLSKKKQITLSEARKELIRKSTQNK